MPSRWLLIAVLSGLLGTSSLAQTCSGGTEGVESQGTCCVAACGTCGGSGCKTRAEAVGLTAADCCARRIHSSDVYCEDSGAAPCIITSEPSESCSNGFEGVEASGVCCAEECGTCGGVGCRARAEAVGLTAHDCCVRRIRSSGTYCNDSGTAPCIVDGAPTSAPSYAPTFSPPTTPMPATTEAPTAAPTTGEFEGLNIPDYLEDTILEDAAGGFAGPGGVAFDDSLPDIIETSPVGSVEVAGVFALQDGEPLNPTTVLYLYIFRDGSEDTEPARGVATVDPETGAFTADVTDVPVGDSTLVLSFVLEDTTEGGSRRHARRHLGSLLASRGLNRAVDRRLATATGTGSVFTVPLFNPSSCENALAITMEWFDGDSDIDLWVTEPSGTVVYYGSRFGSVGFLDFDNVVGYGPENYVLNPDLTPESEVYGTYTISVVGFNTKEKIIPFRYVVRKEGEIVHTEEGSVSQGQRTGVFTVDVERKYVLAVGGRVVSVSVFLNHYSISQWEGLFTCLPEISNEGDLEEMSIEDFQAQYPTAKQTNAIELCAQQGFTGWVLDTELVPGAGIFEDCWDDESIWMSRLVLSSTATTIMPVQWDLTGDIWNDVITTAENYEFAEPPVAGDSCEAVANPTVGGISLERWPLTNYQVPLSDDNFNVNNSNTFIRWLAAQLGGQGVFFREIDDGFDAFPGRDAPEPTDRDGNPLDATHYGPVWDSDADALPIPAGDVDECVF